MDSIEFKNIPSYKGREHKIGAQELISEEPLSIQVDGEPYSVVMRTPGKEIFHAAGFCLAEGLVDSPDDFSTIANCSDLDPNVISVSLEPERRKEVAGILERRGFISQTSCGICGKELIEDLNQILHPVEDKTELTIEKVMACVNQLKERQDLYEKTHASHAAILFDAGFRPVSMAEDVGRHNALDKAIGEVFMSGNMAKVVLAVLSSRISYELVQKAARAGIPILIGLSQPTSLAVTLGDSLNMTIASFRKNRLSIFCGKERIVDGSSE
jgi:FdhD protein